MVMRLAWMIELDQGFTKKKYSVFKYISTTKLEE